MALELNLSTYHGIIDVIQRANEIAQDTELDTLLDHMLDLFIEVAHAEAGTLYLYDAEKDELVFRVVKGDQNSRSLIGTRFPAGNGLAGVALRSGKPIFVPDIAHEARWERRLAVRAELEVRTVYCLPLVLRDRSIGVVQVFNLPEDAIDSPEELALLNFLGSRMVSEVEKLRLLGEAQRREKRLSALVDVISSLTRTLNRADLLQRIMNHARELLDVEATSVWVLNDQTGELELNVATGDHGERMQKIAVPSGKGIIGHVVATGERLLVDDVKNDARYFRDVDQKSGFDTRSILCVPMRSPRIDLGPERGQLEEVILGGAQALNKRNGMHFTADDVELFEVFANQAATVLQLAKLYQDAQNLLWGVIKVVAGAIDAKDPYTQGHSLRVSDYSVAIAEELGQAQEEIYHIKVGGILHDVGKIGVPDAILNKPTRLTDQEMDEMKKHTTKGHSIMSQKELSWLLRKELPALLQHHERLDGGGYPNGIRDIEPIARIVAVADVFDALTSDRPYRAGMSAEQAIDILWKGVQDRELDSGYVEAFCRARAKGKVLTQRELQDREEQEHAV